MLSRRAQKLLDCLVAVQLKSLVFMGRICIGREKRADLNPYDNGEILHDNGESIAKVLTIKILVQFSISNFVNY